MEPTHRTSSGMVIRNGSVPVSIVPPNTPAPKGMVNVTLEAHVVWGDGTGYQLLLDETATQYGITIPLVGALYTSCSAPATLYDVFSHKIPANANPVCTTNNIVMDGSVTIQIPSGTYDWCIVNPTPGDRLWIAGGEGDQMGRRDDYVFQDAYNYHFLMLGTPAGDWVVITTTNANPNLPAAPSNFTATPLGTSLKCNLSWTNPTQTFGGAT